MVLLVLHSADAQLVEGCEMGKLTQLCLASRTRSAHGFQNCPDSQVSSRCCICASGDDLNVTTSLKVRSRNAMTDFKRNNVLDSRFEMPNLLQFKVPNRIELGCHTFNKITDMPSELKGCDPIESDQESRPQKPASFGKRQTHVSFTESHS